MGFMGTTRFLAKGARSKGRRAYFRKLLPGHQQWALMKNMLNDLVREQRIETTLPKAKEVQQYAEELVFLAKKNTPYHDGLVESILTSAEARRILYERMVPRYVDRNFHFTRILNHWRYRERDTAPMAMIEYVDRPGELRPANPVGAARDQFVAQEFLATRKGRRRHMPEVHRMLRRKSGAPLDEAVVERCVFECQKLGFGGMALAQALVSEAASRGGAPAAAASASASSAAAAHEK
mmetsp:Transcript_137588/g.439633  ORF Transcript_137588/g.439633 Transcript_137588/m.439633 type:complete len:237 (-) Transcript_137588:51-761(-)